MISLLGLGRAARIVERNAVAYRRAWFVVLSVLAEPVLYLLSIGIGVGELVGELPGPDGPVSYETFVAPGMMAAVAMNGAVIETTFNFFFRFKYMRSYDAALATPLTPRDVAVGELTTALLRGAFYAAAFLTTMALMGLVESWWGILAVPGALLIGFGFAGVGLAATTWMRSFVDFDYINLALVPLFLFSATFFPLDRYPDLIQWVVRATPLYQGVAIERSLMLGDIHWALLGHAAYLAVMGTIGLCIAARRVAHLLQP